VNTSSEQADLFLYAKGVSQMNSFTQFSSTQQSRHQLEQLWQTPTTQQSTEFSNRLQRFGQWLLQSLTDSDQVRLWTKITPTGTQWYAYDPKTQGRFAGHSESELRIWLENRHR